jgi:hypothetical protein
MRLLSFLNDIETALKQQAAANPGPAWEVTRMVNYHQNLARMMLTPAGGVENNPRGGAILLQSFLLADGSICVKASLAWEGSTTQPVLSVYAKPHVDWPAEATRIASAWLAGPSEGAADTPVANTATS